MSATIPEAYYDLLTAPNFVTFVTLMPDGQPQASVLWSSVENGQVVLNTARGRQKDKNLENDPRVSVVAYDRENPYRYIEIRGIVEEMTEEGALDHINSLSLAYRDNEDYYKNMPQLRGVEQRVKLIIKTLHVVARG